MSQTKFEEGAAALETLLEEVGASIDQDPALIELQSVMDPDYQALQFVRDESRRVPKMPGYYHVLTARDSGERFKQVKTILAGRVVLVPIADRMFPGIISVDGLTDGRPGQENVVRFSYINHPYSARGMTPDQKIFNSITAQAETKSMGSHSRTDNPNTEAEHLLALEKVLLTARDTSDWTARPVHLNHVWKDMGGSVMNMVTAGGDSLIADLVVSAPHYLSPDHWPHPDFSLLWHEALETENGIEAGDQPHAMTFAQGLGLLTIVSRDRENSVREVLAA